MLRRAQVSVGVQEVGGREGVKEITAPIPVVILVVLLGMRAEEEEEEGEGVDGGSTLLLRAVEEVEAGVQEEEAKQMVPVGLPALK